MEHAWPTALGEPVARLGRAGWAYLPVLLGAAALVLAGWLLGRLLHRLTVRYGGRLHWLAHSRAVEGALSRVGVERPLVELLGRILFWVVFLTFLTAATEMLGLPVVATWLRALADHLPNVVLGILIVLAGVLVGALARDAIASGAGAAGVVYGQLLGRMAQLAIVLIAAVTAVDQIGIDSKFVTLTITVVIAAVAGAAALAVGLGARTAVSNIIAAHYVQQAYRIGQTVRVGAVEGRIVDITTTAVVLDGLDGRVFVPANAFSESVSVLLTRES
jgi:small-conductance mechanosensitive channel